jgi:hypothetical protein
MTIKQQGGVFGRNPTFNNVEVDGTATLDNIASSDKLRVTASDNPAAYLEFENTFQNTGIASQAGLLLGVNSSAQTNYAGVIATENGNNTNGVLLGLYANNGAGPILVAQARNNKNFEIVDGDLVVASGHGIDFSATAGTGTSELFDDYEEGTFTPVIADAATGGNTGTASQAYGYYTKVGRNVTIHLNMTDIDTTGLTAGNDVYIQGLPFTSLAVTGLITYNGSIWGALINLESATPYLVPAVADGQSAILLKEWGDNLGTDNLIVSELTSGSSDLNISLSYFAA